MKKIECWFKDDDDDERWSPDPHDMEDSWEPSVAADEAARLFVEHQWCEEIPVGVGAAWELPMDPVVVAVDGQEFTFKIQVDFDPVFTPVPIVEGK